MQCQKKHLSIKFLKVFFLDCGVEVMVTPDPSVKTVCAICIALDKYIFVLSGQRQGLPHAPTTGEPPSIVADALLIPPPTLAY